MGSKVKLLTPSDLTELWRPRPDFIGPSMPPMIAYQRAGEPEDTWKIFARQRKQPIAAGLFEWAESAA
jgi:hypothetical protein